MTAGMLYPLLDTVHDPEHLRALPEAHLPQLADELRRFLIDSVGRTGGHLAANLGVVELTVALHYVYHTPAGRLVWAVIGDGALTAGMAFEALNHAGDLHTDLLVILNDNDMSISPNVGGLSNHLARILSGKLYVGLREQGKKALKNMPPVWELARRAEEHVKGMVVPGTLFEELGFNYIGPVDGHDLPTLVMFLRFLCGLLGLFFLFVVFFLVLG